MPNQLSREESTYLKQHASNPVDWRAWNAESLLEAERRQLPVLVSIGYSTCHWCHVMERESFEDAEVAAALNRGFIAIKVDREELPDVDSHFMHTLVTMSGRGGWPLNMFLTPDLKPFYGGTYFPKPLFLQILAQVESLWKTEPHKVREQAEVFTARAGGERGLKIGTLSTAPTADHAVEHAIALRERALQSLGVSELARLDPVWGGFGRAPKFPRSHGLSALLRLRHGVDFAVEHTLKAMAYGGLRDHLGGGFHRYSTDERWLVPHFEKMLYDQALLLTTYSEAWAVYKKPLYRDVVAELLEFLERDMRLANGLFAAAWDADSEGHEGRYYVFSAEELHQIFVAEDAEAVGDFFLHHSIEYDGNWEGQNVLAAPLDSSWDEVQAPTMRRMRAKLFAHRAKRTAPIRDDKAIVAWNGWMTSALFKASLNLAGCGDGELSARLAAAGARSLDALVEASRVDNDWRLPRVVYATGARGAGYLEDHAALIEALQYGALALDSDAHWASARALLELVHVRFVDADGRVRPSDRGANAGLSQRLDAQIDEQDGANPAPLSILVPALYRQALRDSNSGLADRAGSMLAALEPLLVKFPVVLSYLLSELDVVSGQLWKVPPDARASVRADLSKEGRFAGEVLVVAGVADRYEACDHKSCFLRATDESALWAALDRGSGDC